MTHQSIPPQGQWSDREITGSKQDRFATQDYANVLANRAATADTPLTIGVFGRWGSGKTSLMRLVQDSLTHRKQPIPSIWINVWQLSSRDELWSAFLQALLTGVRERLPWHRLWGFNWSLFWERVRWGALFRMLFTNSYRVLVALIPLLVSLLWPNIILDTASDRMNFILSLLTGGTASIILAIWLVITPMIKVFEEKVSIDLDVILKQSPYEIQVSELQKIQKQFARLVKTAVGNVGRLVIFIDDLDRCTPDKIPEVLEAIKLFTETPLCVYVLGLDYEVVQAGLKTKYKFKNKSDAAEYLEKLIQIPFHLPPLDDKRISDYVGVDYADVRAICPTAPEVFSKGLEPNPRKVKRALNIYRTLWELAEARVEVWEMDPVEPELLAKMVVIQNRYRDLNEQLIRDPKLLHGLERWAWLITHPDDYDPLMEDGNEVFHQEEIADRKELFASLEKLVPERDRSSLAMMLIVGERTFRKIPLGGLSSYIYLTGTLEGVSDLARPSRQEKIELLSNRPELIQTRIAVILGRAGSPESREGLAKAYLTRLKKMLIPLSFGPGEVIPPPKYTEAEHKSAGYAIACLIVLGFENPAAYLEMLLQEYHAVQGSETNYTSELAFALQSSSEGEKGYVAGLKDLLAEKYRSIDSTTANIILSQLLELEHADFEPQMVKIPAGTFEMGLSEEQAKLIIANGQDEKVVKWSQPQHTIELSEYWLGKYPITNQEYQFFVQATGHKPPSHWERDQYPRDLAQHPVTWVSWSDANAYCKWLTDKTGKPYRLPTEAEWEKAARGADGRIYPWGNEWEAGKCNSKDAGIGSTTPVGQYSPAGDSPFGCADMAGNVWEWCADGWNEQAYSGRAGKTVKDPREPASGIYVLRGGSYYHDHPWMACASRSRGLDYIYDYCGFRVAASPASL